MRHTAHRPIVRSDQAVEAAMADHGTAVYRFALVVTGSRFDADDVYQDVFLRFATDGTALENADHLRAWLLRVTANRCRDLRRAARRCRPADAQALEVLVDPAGSTSLDRLMADDLWQAVEQLAPRERAAVHLVYGERLSCNEAARILRTRPSTLRTRLQRARVHLKALLGKGWM